MSSSAFQGDLTTGWQGRALKRRASLRRRPLQVAEPSDRSGGLAGTGQLARLQIRYDGREAWVSRSSRWLRARTGSRVSDASAKLEFRARSPRHAENSEVARPSLFGLEIVRARLAVSVLPTGAAWRVPITKADRARQIRWTKPRRPRTSGAAGGIVNPRKVRDFARTYATGRVGPPRRAHACALCGRATDHSPTPACPVQAPGQI